MEPYVQLIRAENERLRKEIESLKDQIKTIVDRLDSRESPGYTKHTAIHIQRPTVEKAPNTPPGLEELSRNARLLWDRLPHNFTVEDLIDISEDMDLNVFETYKDLQTLIKADLVIQKELFEKVQPQAGETHYR